MIAFKPWRTHHACSVHTFQKRSCFVGQPILAGVSRSDMHSSGASPPWTVMTGTIRLGRNLGGDVQQADMRPTWRCVTLPAAGMPDSHADVMGVDPMRPGEEGMSYLER